MDTSPFFCVHRSGWRGAPLSANSYPILSYIHLNKEASPPCDRHQRLG